MRDLLRILLRFYFVILFVILEIFSLSIYINSNQNHKNKVLNSSHIVIAGFYRMSASVYQYFNLRKINYQLVQENASLKSKLKSAYKDNKVSLIDIYDSVYSKKYTYIEARVINNSINKQHNYFTLDKGSNQGILPEMAVISPTGIVGIVKEVSKNYASAISILNTKLNISAKLKNSGYFGTLTWNGKDHMHLLLKDIPNHVERSIGDTVITSGYSVIFPEGQLIGTISGFSNEQEGNFFDIIVEVSTDFKNLTYVYIIGNLDKEEQTDLEKKAIDD